MGLGLGVNTFFWFFFKKMCLDVKKRTINMCEGSCTHMKEIKRVTICHEKCVQICASNIYTFAFVNFWILETKCILYLKI